ncbi:hypothetical protein [Sphingomonas bacterium]|uniref:hypothetical protein n=1 Tax=Sphingomonas bacterium TaxID=1895847 RepID=UPI002633AFEA|nr:hypothetical protein [Sphingomonas bacterium]
MGTIRGAPVTLPPLAPLLPAASVGVSPAVMLDPEPVTDRRTALRRNAVFHLFDRAGLGPPPLLLWSFIASDDVGRGVESFLRVTGTDREPSRLDDLLRAEPGLRRAAAGERSAWLADLLSGDPARFTAAAASARRVTRSRLDEHWPADLIPASRPEQAHLADDLASALGDHKDHRAALLAHWPDAWTSRTEGDQVCAAIAAFEAAEVTALASLTDGRDGKTALITMQAANMDLEALAARASGTAGSGPVTPVDTAALDAATAWPEALREWRALRWQHHPERPELDDAVRAERRRRCAVIDRALDRRERLLRTGTP